MQDLSAPKYIGKPKHTFHQWQMVKVKRIARPGASINLCMIKMLQMSPAKIKFCLSCVWYSYRAETSPPKLVSCGVVQIWTRCYSRGDSPSRVTRVRRLSLSHSDTCRQHANSVTQYRLTARLVELLLFSLSHWCPDSWQRRREPPGWNGGCDGERTSNE